MCGCGQAGIVFLLTYEVGEMVCMEVNGTSEASTHSTGVQDDMYDAMPWGGDGPSG